MNKKHVPDTIAPPLAAYSHGIEIPPNARVLHTAGQVGILPDGTTPEGVEAQTEATWVNLMAILESAGMGIDDVVKVTTYVTNEEDFWPMAKVRARFFGDARPASTGIVVKALAKQEWLVEVDLVAAKA
ncbi:MAG: RidA family protein [Gammaproteobacteria bacterium]|nr:RidA family protein [Gammaproteobacteria bacterium]